MATQSSIEKAAQVWCDPRCSGKQMDVELATVFAELIDKENEFRIMNLAGISTASIQNTETTIKDRIGRENPYWTVAYNDVCVAIDREIKWRNLYNELIFSVGNKFDKETRHETALRYIRQSETHNESPASEINTK